MTELFDVDACARIGRGLLNDPRGACRGDAGRAIVPCADGSRPVSTRRLAAQAGERLKSDSRTTGAGVDIIDVATARSVRDLRYPTRRALAGPTDTADIPSRCALSVLRRHSRRHARGQSDEWAFWAPTASARRARRGPPPGILGMGRIRTSRSRAAPGAFGIADPTITNPQRRGRGQRSRWERDSIGKALIRLDRAVDVYDQHFNCPALRRPTFTLMNARLAQADEADAVIGTPARGESDLTKCAESDAARQ